MLSRYWRDGTETRSATLAIRHTGLPFPCRRGIKSKIADAICVPDNLRRLQGNQAKTVRFQSKLEREATTGGGRARVVVTEIGLIT